MITAIDKNTALVLLNLQKGFAALPLVHPVKEVLGNANILIEAFRKAGLPIILVNLNPVGAQALTVRKEFAPPPQTDPHWTELINEIGGQSGDIYVTTQTWNAFDSSNIHEKLQEHNTTGIVLGGLFTSVQVEGTARGANARGYNIAFASDAITDMNADAHVHSFKFILPRIGEIDTTENILQFL